MALLGDLVTALASGDVRVVDLTQPLSERTPVLFLPEPFANTPGLSRRPISRYDDAGPAWAWDVLEVGEHVGTHFDAPIHWITGRDGEDVASVPPVPAGRAGGGDRQVRRGRVGPGLPAHARRHPRLRVRARRAARGRLAAAAHRLGLARLATRTRSSTAATRPARTPSARAGWPRRRRSPASAWRPLAPTRASRTASSRPFPVHHFLLGAGRYGITQLANLAELPPTGAVIVVAPLKLVDGTGSPSRVLALV